MIAVSLIIKIRSII